MLLLAVTGGHYTYAAYPEKTIVTTPASNTLAVSSVRANDNNGSLEVLSQRKNKKEASKYRQAMGYGRKTKLAAILWGLTLGSFGAHSFYMGQTVKGFIQLGGTVGGFALLLSNIASAGSTVAGTLVPSLMCSERSFFSFFTVQTPGEFFESLSI